MEFGVYDHSFISKNILSCKRVIFVAVDYFHMVRSKKTPLILRLYQLYCERKWPFAVTIRLAAQKFSRILGYSPLPDLKEGFTIFLITQVLRQTGHFFYEKQDRNWEKQKFGHKDGSKKIAAVMVMLCILICYYCYQVVPSKLAD